jgi:hypothetical protein
MKKTLNKILDELNKESPRLDYIKGMLEVLIEEEQIIIPPNVILNKGDIKPIPMVNIGGEIIMDEASMLEARAREAVATIKALSDASTE